MGKGTPALPYGGPATVGRAVDHLGAGPRARPDERTWMSRVRGTTLHRIRSTSRASKVGRALALVAALSASGVGAFPLSAQAGDPSLVEGRWLGTAGTPLDRIAIGFDFRRDSVGALVGHLYQPVGNYYDFPMLGPVTSDSAGFHARDWPVHFVVRGDTLQGTMFFNRVPLTLTRSDTLPSEVPVPELPAGPGPAWQVKLGAPIYAQAVVRDGMAYVGTSGGLFHAIAESDGRFVWTFTAGRPIHGAAAVSDSAVYFVCDNGYLFKVRRETGDSLWRYDLGDSRVDRVLMHQVVENSGDFAWDLASPTPALVGDTLYVGSGDGAVHAVDARTGQRIWRFQADTKVRGTVVVDGDRVTFGTFGGIVYAVHRRTGEKVWEARTGGPIVNSVVLVGDKIVVGNRYGILAAFEASTGSRVWVQQMWGSSAESEAAPAGGSLFYFGSSDLRRISYMDALDGRVLWRTDVFGFAWPRPVLHGDVVYVSTVGAEPYQMRHLGAFSALDRTSGAILWRWPASPAPGNWGFGFFAPAAVGDTHVVVGGLDGTLYGFPVS